MTRAGWRRDNLNVILMSEHVPLVGTRPATTTTTAQPKTKTNAVLQLCREQSAKNVCEKPASVYKHNVGFRCENTIIFRQTDKLHSRHAV